jgi:RNA polymerase sigma-70 factor, ECF subfamily
MQMSSGEPSLGEGFRRNDIEEVAMFAGLGIESAQKELYRRCKPSVSRVVEAFLTRGGSEVDDVVQETFIRVFEQLHRLREPALFRPWLFAIARNRSRDALLRRKADWMTRERMAGEIVDPFEDGFGEHESRSAKEALNQLLAGLPESPEKETARLFYDGELTAQKIAERLGTGKSVVTMRLVRFRARLKRVLIQQVLDGVAALQ